MKNPTITSRDIFNNKAIIKNAETDFDNQIKKTKRIAHIILSFGILLIASSIIAASVIVIGTILKAFTLSIFLTITILTASLVFLLVGIIVLIAACSSLSRLSKKTLKSPFPVKNANDVISSKPDFEKIYKAIQNLLDSSDSKKEDLETLNHFRNFLFIVNEYSG